MPKNKINHIAFILDGNKRWAKLNNFSLKGAYKKGLENISNLIEYSINLKINHLTLFTLSSENIKRNSIKNIFEVIYDDFAFFLDKIIHENQVKIKIIGSRNNLPSKILTLIDHCEKKTINNSKLKLNLAFNYGFKDEIKLILNKVSKNKSINVNEDASIKKLFFLGNIPDPDILIRTGGEKRLSNFIMYNLTYTELFFIETLWPDFKFIEYKNIITDYNKISRRYGL